MDSTGAAFMRLLCLESLLNGSGCWTQRYMMRSSSSRFQSLIALPTCRAPGPWSSLKLSDASQVTRIFT